MHVSSDRRSTGRFKKGEVIIVVDDEDRENEGDFVALAEHATPEVINFMATHGRGLICTPLSEEIADRLDLHPMVEHNTDSHHTAFTVSIDHRETKTGISAQERSLPFKHCWTANPCHLIFSVRGTFFH